MLISEHCVVYFWQLLCICVCSSSNLFSSLINMCSLDVNICTQRSCNKFSSNRLTSIWFYLMLPRSSYMNTRDFSTRLSWLHSNSFLTECCYYCESTQQFLNNSNGVLHGFNFIFYNILVRKKSDNSRLYIKIIYFIIYK